MRALDATVGTAILLMGACDAGRRSDTPQRSPSSEQRRIDAAALRSDLEWLLHPDLRVRRVTTSPRSGTASCRQRCSSSSASNPSRLCPALKVPAPVIARPPLLNNDGNTPGSSSPSTETSPTTPPSTDFKCIDDTAAKAMAGITETVWSITKWEIAWIPGSIWSEARDEATPASPSSPTTR